MGCYPSSTQTEDLIGKGLSPPTSPIPQTNCWSNPNKNVMDLASPTATAKGWVSPEPEALADKSKLSPSPLPAHPTKGRSLPAGSVETPLDLPTPKKPTSRGPDPKATDALGAGTPPVTPAKLPTVTVAKYGASVSVGNGKFMPVGSNPNTPVATKIDFEAEKAKIEAAFTALEAHLDAGTRDRGDIEKEFEILTGKADRLRRLQEAEQAANRHQHAPRATQLAPVQVAERSAEDRNTPSMAVVHWKKVTKAEYQAYKEKLIDRYGAGTEKVKSVERIPNRIIITAPVSTVMEQILADEDLNPRPEPYVMPGKGGASAPKQPPSLAPLAPLSPLTSVLPPRGLPAGKLAPLSPVSNPFGPGRSLPPITAPVAL